MERKARPRNQSHVKRKPTEPCSRRGCSPRPTRTRTRKEPRLLPACSPPGPGCSLWAGDDRHRTARRAAPLRGQPVPSTPLTKAEDGGGAGRGNAGGGQSPHPEPVCSRARHTVRAPGPSTYLPLVRWADVEAVDDGGHAGLQGELGVGRPEVRRPGGEGDSCQRPASPRRAHGSRTGRSAGHGRCGRSTPDSPERGPPRPGLPRGHRALALACSGEAA